MSDLFYRPAGAWAADFIPFCEGSCFHLFYLHDWRDVAHHGEGTPWYQVTTADFVHFDEQGEMLARGDVEAQDLYVFTGSVLTAQDGYHIFYTGHNPHLRSHGRPEQGIMHGVSTDLVHWTKRPADTFYAPEGYEPHDWRDPFVFWNEEAGEYWMLLAARQSWGPSRRRGCTALCASRDLAHWEVRRPFYAPGLYFTHECPDLFRLGDWWYLLFSEFTDACVTRYRMSRSLAGPWISPADDAFDTRVCYAAKTASDGRRRYLFGWNATREGNTDTGAWQWGGNLVVHELVQRPDGTLAARVPESVLRAVSEPWPLALRPGLGECSIVGHNVELAVPGSFGCALAGEMPVRCRLEATATLAPGTRGAGLMLRASEDLEAAYYVRLEPERQRLVFDTWPRAGDVPFMPGLERPLHLAAGRAVTMQVLVDDTVCEVYVDGQVALSTRLYGLRGGQWGVFVQQGAAKFAGLASFTS